MAIILVAINTGKYICTCISWQSTDAREAYGLWYHLGTDTTLNS